MRPRVHVNCAMSADGKIAGADRTRVRISSDEDMARVAELRRRCGCILVGVGTVAADDPHLVAKGAPRGARPARAVLDPRGRTPDGARVLDGEAPTVIFTDASCAREWEGARAVRCPGGVRLPLVLDELAAMGVEDVLVEGGGETIASFFAAGLVDEYTVYVGSMVIGGRTAPTPADGDGWAAPGGVGLALQSAERLGGGVLLSYAPRR